jgi:hypothetical protein
MSILAGVGVGIDLGEDLEGASLDAIVDGDVPMLAVAEDRLFDLETTYTFMRKEGISSYRLLANRSDSL